jgi:salicylate hydroxylase
MKRAMPTLSVGIAGAGPAGLSAALFLARDGHRVTLFERFATPHPVGSGLMLQPTGLAVLAELELADRVMSLGQRIERLFGRVMPSDRIILDVNYRRLGPGRFCLAVHRAALFEPLFAAAQQHPVAIETGQTVTGLDRLGDGRPILLTGEGGRHGPFDLVIDALGTRSPLAGCFGGGPRRDFDYGALWSTVPWPPGEFAEHALEQRYRKANVMAGVLPIGRRRHGEPEATALFWSIKPSDYETWRSRGLDAWKADVLQLWPETAPLLGSIADADQLTLARYAHHTLACPAAERLVAIGDAAHATSPQLGQGANMALLDARALALALREATEVSDALASYVKMRRWHIRFYQYLSALFTPFYQSDSRLLPVLRDWGLAPATRLPLARTFVAATIAGIVIDPRKTLRLGEAPADASAANPKFASQLPRVRLRTSGSKRH